MLQDSMVKVMPYADCPRFDHRRRGNGLHGDETLSIGHVKGRLWLRLFRVQRKEAFVMQNAQALSVVPFKVSLAGVDSVESS